MSITPYAVSTEPSDSMSRNVKDFYKKNSAEEIRADLQTKRSSAIQVFMNLENDFNVATAIRTHNALNAKELYVVGRRKYDRRGTVGTHHYVTSYSADTFDEVFDKLKKDGYTIFAIENNVEGRVSNNLWDMTFPSKSAFVYGTENMGLSMNIIDKCDELILIEMYGSVRSLNLATASSIVLAEYSRQHRHLR